MLWTIFVILVILWILGFSFHIGGGLIHILLVIALAAISAVKHVATAVNSVFSNVSNTLA